MTKNIKTWYNRYVESEKILNPFSEVEPLQEWMDEFEDKEELKQELKNLLFENLDKLNYTGDRKLKKIKTYLDVRQPVKKPAEPKAPPLPNKVNKYIDSDEYLFRLLKNKKNIKNPLRLKAYEALKLNLCNS